MANITYICIIYTYTPGPAVAMLSSGAVAKATEKYIFAYPNEYLYGVFAYFGFGLLWMEQGALHQRTHEASERLKASDCSLTSHIPQSALP